MFEDIHIPEIVQWPDVIPPEVFELMITGKGADAFRELMPQAFDLLLSPSLVSFWRGFRQRKANHKDYLKTAYTILTTFINSNPPPEHMKINVSQRKKDKQRAIEIINELRAICERQEIHPALLIPKNGVELCGQEVVFYTPQELDMALPLFEHMTKIVSINIDEAPLITNTKISSFNRSYFVINLTKIFEMNLGTPLHEQVAIITNILFPPENKYKGLDRNKVRSIVRGK